MKSRIESIKRRYKNYISKRPHRTFRLSNKRDYKRQFDLPGYFAFTIEAMKLIKKNYKVLFGIGLVFCASTFVFVGILSQDVYQSIVDTFNQTKGNLFEGLIGELSGASLIFSASLSGGLLVEADEIQQLYSTIITIIIVMAYIWALRNLMANKNIKIRDALYNCGSPIVAFVLVVLIIVLQLIPFAIVLIAYNAAQATGLLAGGVEAMMFWAFAVVLSGLSLYWLVGSFFSLIIATLPGMYPMRAIQVAGEMVIGRRLSVIYRLIWMVFVSFVFWIIVLIPTIVIDSKIKMWLSWTDWIPVVPLVILVLNAITIMWMTTYSYLLYRKIVDNDK